MPIAALRQLVTWTEDEAPSGLKPRTNHHLHPGFPPRGFLTSIGQSSFVRYSSMCFQLCGGVPYSASKLCDKAQIGP